MDNEKPNYYSILPATVRYDKDLTDKAKLLYSEITSLCNANGECWASNSYFAELYSTSTNNVSKLIKSLIDRKYLERKIFYKEGTKEIEKRVLIPIGENYNTYCKKLQYPIGENYKENNTSINNNKERNNINIISKESESNSYKNFIKPTIEDIKLYCEERGNTIDAEQFYDFYESKGWKIGKNSMKDWKAAVRTWERNHKEETHSEPLIREVREGVYQF
ncbi:MAG: helix-turn-helix domain-containing protein [Bacilli bacterium]|nr:helix-turn-helix domain-containing protein [Bacilli bacterium]